MRKHAASGFFRAILIITAGWLAAGNAGAQAPTRPLIGLFFVQDNRAKNDRPEHFAHANSAVAMTEVWLATDDVAAFRKQGLILLDGGVPQSAGQIAANITKLGFRIEDIELIVSSHAHYDHAGGIAALQRASGATVGASAAGAAALRRGEPTEDDPQFGFRATGTNGFPRVPEVRAVAEGETLHVGELAITAHLTPGHTPGSTSWTWRSCEGDRCLDVVYADSLSAVSAPGFRFGEGGRAQAFARSIAVVEKLPCDVLLTPHPWDFDLDGKLKRRAGQPDVNPFVQPGACKAYAARARQNLERRVEEE